MMYLGVFGWICLVGVDLVGIVVVFVGIEDCVNCWFCFIE